jgi:diguanylate cyclase (GGDEF)-like protein/PAS domain S-box-containing protein
MTRADTPSSVRAATETAGALNGPRRAALTRGQRSLWIMAALALVALGAVFSYLVYREYESTLARERDRMLMQVRVIDENLSQELLGANAALANIVRDVAALVAQGQQVQMIDRLQALSDAMPGVRTMLVVNASGTVIASSRPELMGVDLGQRAYFQRAKAHPVPGRLYLSEPFKTQLGVFSVNLLKIWTDEKGQFAGLVAATLDPDFFQVLLRSVLYAEQTRSTVIHGNGQVFVSVPAIDAVSEPGHAEVDAFFKRHRDSGNRESIFTGTTGTTGAVGEERMAAYRSTQPAELNMDQPLVATISRPVAAVLAPWRAVARLYALMYCLLAATVLFAAWLVHYKRQALTELRAIRDRESLEHAERLNLALEGGDLGLWDIDLETGMRTVNNRARTMVGQGSAEPAESVSEWAERVHPDDLGPWQAARQAHAAGETESLVADYRVRHRDGHWVWLHSSGRVTQRDANGAALRMTGIYLDVTERQANEARIKHASEQLARMSRVSRTGGWDYHLGTGRSSWSPEMYRICDLDPSVEPNRQTVMDAFFPESRELLAAAGTTAIKQHIPWDIELQMTTARGRTIWVRTQGEAVVENGRTVGLTGTLRNVTGQKQSQIDLKIANEKLERMALSDGLTGIANRRLFDQTLKEEWLRGARSGQPLALLMIDIDHFKRYNDHYGHAGGDECLRRVAQALASCSRRAGDLVSRYGGEEFAILLPGADSAAASQVAQVCLDRIRDEQIVHANSSAGPWLSVSIGVASVEVNAARPVLSLLERADAALYRAKRLGRARYETLGNSAIV